MSEKTRAWTFLSNHGHVLVYLNNHTEAKVKEIAEEVGITERSAQTILHELELAGYIVKTKQGRRNHYRINPKGKFRHPQEKDRSVGSLLEIFNN